MGVADSWAVVKQDLEGNGVKFFIDFFAQYPQYQDRFAKLKGLSAGELAGSAAMRAQAVAVLNVIDAAVANIGNKGALAAALAPVAQTHVGYGIKSAFFADAFAAFVVFLGKSGVPTDGWDAATATILDALRAELVKNGGS